MAATLDLCAVARKFGEGVTFEIVGQKYKTTIHNVYFKSPADLKTTYKEPIMGMGFTIEDSCMDYMRLARGGYLYHILTGHTEVVI